MTNFRGHLSDSNALSNAERDQLIATLCEVHQFPMDALLQWLESCGSNTFYTFDDTRQIDASNAAQRLYLERVYSREGMTYADDMRMMSEGMFANRFADYPAPVYWSGTRFTPAMDAALMMLADHINHYKVLCAFDAPQYAAMDAATLTALADHIAAQPTDFAVSAFAMEWAQFHIRLHAKPPGKATPRRDDSSSDGMQPTGLQP